MADLKPCPFCGGAASIQRDVRYPGRSNGRKAFEVLCLNPDCVIYRADNKYFFTKKEAVAAWNKRVEQPILYK